MRYSTQTIPMGDAGIARTLDVMLRAAEEGSRYGPLILWAQQAVRFVPARDVDAEAAAVFNAVRRSFRYTKDPVTAELVKTPEVLMNEITRGGVAIGDCDDYVTFLIAALQAVGIEAHPTVVSEDGGTYGHVLVRYRGRGGWTALDPITDRQPGWFPGHVRRAADYRDGAFRPFDPAAAAGLKRMGSLSLVERPRLERWMRPSPTVERPAPAAAYPALAGVASRSTCGGICGGACGDCADRPGNAFTRLNDSLARYTDLMWWAWATATVVGALAYRRRR